VFFEKKLCVEVFFSFGCDSRQKKGERGFVEIRVPIEIQAMLIEFRDGEEEKEL
jgi:hypothetical protein